MNPSATPPDSHDHDDVRFPDEDLPEGAVVDGAELRAPVSEEYDFVVVGSGAAGSVAAHTLASAGWTVAIVEEGPWLKTRSFKDDVLGTFRTMLRDSGTQVLKGRVFMPLLQGKCVGGSTLVNSAIAWRLPEDVVDEWRATYGTGDLVTMKSLEPHFDALERDLNVHAVLDDVLGENNRRFLATAKSRGIRATRMRRYERGCKGSGQCLTGCPHAAKQGMSVSYVPWTLATGRARIFTSCHVERVDVRGRRAVGVIATAVNPSRTRVLLRARRGVFVAASTVQTPNLLRRSGLRARAIGQHFQSHPGVGAGGYFDERIGMVYGATQGAESIDYRLSDRFKLETISMPPELAAARVPFIGPELSRRLATFANVGIWVANVRMKAEGVVDTQWDGRDRVRFTPNPEDMQSVRKALGVVAHLLLDGGAREVWPGVHGVPSMIGSHDQVKLIEEGPLDPRAYSFVATHLFGAARMGPDPRTSAVGLDFATHEARALYVVDSSIFPTNLGVNPQHSIMALARLAATRVAADAAHGAAA
ncbi:MAG TPA: GMC family oxidoreductase [Polyangiaceae bacterium]|jgi:choline dehydrogenase-like flavoprotein